ncbi:MAG: hypothetical protein ACREN3_09545, partial [Gemmatimonadaceae bacterium]
MSSKISMRRHDVSAGIESGNWDEAAIGLSLKCPRKTNVNKEKGWIGGQNRSGQKFCLTPPLAPSETPAREPGSPSTLFAAP